jgi:predicted DNA-binding transcriptional regulator YafY
MAERLERLINLVIALRETRVPMTAAEIRGRIGGYGQADAETFRRMFERDKADLRALGVPLETAAVDAWGDRLGYRIDPRRYDLPPVSLEPGELAALALALEATGLAVEAGGGLLKLSIDAGEPRAALSTTTPAVDVDIDAPYRATLMEAQITRTTVRFEYRPLGRAAATRTVDPHALVHRRGRWYLIGRDHGRDERRAFRLDRIEGGVHPVGQPGAFPPAQDDVRVDDVVPGARDTQEPAMAEVLAVPEVAWQVARRARGGGRPELDGRTAFTIPVLSPEPFVAWVLEYGPDLEVRAPAELRERVVAALERVLATARSRPSQELESPPSWGSEPPGPPASRGSEPPGPPASRGAEPPGPPASRGSEPPGPTGRSGSRPTRTLQRLERILAMVPWLLDHPGVPVAEVVERFGVTRRQLAEDLDVLGYCGLPGYGGGDLVEASIVGDRVSVRMADFFRRPLRLSLREAMTLLLAARALASVGSLPEAGDLGRAAGKLQAALTGSPSRGPGRPPPGGAGAGLDEARLAIVLRAPGDEYVPDLRRAVDQQRVVHLVYRSASKAETTERDVEPWALVGAGGAWYLQGHCRLARAPRDFRLDRIRELAVTDERFAGRSSPSEAPPAYRPRRDDVEVVLELCPEAAWIGEEAVLDSVEKRGDVTLVTLRARELDWAARLVIRLGGGAAVVSPRELAERVEYLADQTLRRYRDQRISS